VLSNDLLGRRISSGDLATRRACFGLTFDELWISLFSDGRGMLSTLTLALGSPGDEAALSKMDFKLFSRSMLNFFISPDVTLDRLSCCMLWLLLLSN
jgi:hypothetical protein